MKYYDIKIYQDAALKLYYDIAYMPMLNSTLLKVSHEIIIEFKGPNTMVEHFDIAEAVPLPTNNEPVDVPNAIMEHILIPLELVSPTTLYKEFITNPTPLDMWITAINTSYTSTIDNIIELSYCIKLRMTQREINLIQHTIETLELPEPKEFSSYQEWLIYKHYNTRIKTTIWNTIWNTIIDTLFSKISGTFKKNLAKILNLFSKTTPSP